MRIRTGDNVMVIAGKEKGKTGRVERQFPENDRVVIEGVNIVTRHMKGRPGVRQSGRIQKEAAVHVSNVALICNKCNRPTRPRITTLDTGSRVRSCPKCQEVIDDAR
jgi:large subunit ribosomal protein L24